MQQPTILGAIANGPKDDPYFTAIARQYLEANPQFSDRIVTSDAALKRYLVDPMARIPDRQADPAKRALAAEELINYPGVIAVAAHEEAYKLYRDNKHAEARKLAEAAHRYTGIDIHPGAALGSNLFIDHGTGIVIGEQTQIGERTVIYHDSTLGAIGNTPEGRPRHPVIGNDCTVSVGVEILGNVRAGDKVVFGPSSRVIGNNVVLGDGVSIAENVHIYDNVTVAPGIRIGSDAVIAKNAGTITKEDLSETEGRIPPYSVVSRDDAGQLQIESLHARRIYREPNGPESSLPGH